MRKCVGAGQRFGAYGAHGSYGAFVLSAPGCEEDVVLRRSQGSPSAFARRRSQSGRTEIQPVDLIGIPIEMDQHVNRALREARNKLRAHVLHRLILAELT